MRILVVAHGVADQSLLGGPGRVAIAHAHALDALGHQVHIVTSNVVGKGESDPNPTFFRTLGKNIRVDWTKSWSLAAWPGTIGPILSIGSRSLLTRAVDDVDIVHVHEWPFSLVHTARRLAKAAGKPCIVHPHGSIQPRTGWKRAVHLGGSLRQPALDGETVLAGSEAEAAEIRACMPSYDGPIEILPNPMPLSAVTHDDPEVLRRRNSWGLPAGATALLYAHRLVPNKGLDLLVDALAQLPPEFHVVVVGAMTKFGESCLARAKASAVDGRIHFVGPVSGDHIDEVILAADVFLLPARRDTFPLMILHALACGAPVVMTTGCQSVELVDGAVAVAAPDPSVLASTIASLDDGEKRRLGNAGRQLIRSRFSPEAVGKRLEGIYRRQIYGSST